jgi:hypothetical protein
LAGRFLVLMPMGDYIAVSKRIKSYKERRNLRQLVQNIVPDGFGVIVRTVAEGVDEALIETDLRDLLAKWNNLVAQLETAKPPTLVHRDLEMTESLIRDLFAKDYDRILVDDKKMFLQTFRDHGLPIDQMHVERAGNLGIDSSAEAKKIIFRKYINTKNYIKLRLFDDAMSNLKAFLSLQDEYPNIKFEAYFVNSDGSIRTIK